MLRIRGAILWGLALAAWVGGASLYKNSLLLQLERDSAATVGMVHAKVQSLFQSSYFFAFQDQFVPGIQEQLRLTGVRTPQSRISRVWVLTGSGAPETPGTVLYDSAQTGSSPPSGGERELGAHGFDPRFAERIREVAAQGTAQPILFRTGLSVLILMSEPGTVILYQIEGKGLAARLWAFLLAGFALLGLLYWWSHGGSRAPWLVRIEEKRRAWAARNWRLQPKVLAGIFVINVVGAAVVYLALIQDQTRVQKEMTAEQSLRFTVFATPEIIYDFRNYFYFFFNERFVPEIKRITASNPNLRRIQVIAVRKNQVLFDSFNPEFTADARSAALLGSDSTRAPAPDFPPEVREQLKEQDVVTWTVQRGGEELLLVANTYRNENNEAQFWVQCEFSYETLKKIIAGIRKKVLISFLPSLLIGFLLAYLFARFLIQPIRRLRDALQRVSAGDYEATVGVRQTDELGDLASAFNTMTSELKKKKELRKYLSDSTYRQIMEAPENPEGNKVRGAHVFATVLFCDIRNFVHHCENLGADEITAMLNEYFSEMVEVVHKYGGEIDKFIGDAFLAVFYATDEVKTIRPVEQDYGRAPQTGTATVLDAIYCSMEMRERLREFNRKRKAVNKEQIDIGVGISFGEIISGPIGSKDRMDFTVIGDVVNLASRIEKLSKLGTYTKVVFSHQVEEKVKGLLDYHELETDGVRGKEEEVRVYELIGIRDLQTLVGNLKTGDKDLQRRSLDLLGQSRNPAALVPVLGALKDADEGVQLAAIIAIGKLAPRNDAVALDALFSIIEQTRSERLIATGIATIGKICSDEKVFRLVPFLESRMDRVVANAVEAIGQARNPEATDRILPLLNSRNNRVKANAAMAVFAAGRFEVVDTLKPMLMHSEPLMRSSAAFAIGELTQIAARQQFADRWKEDPSGVKVFLAEIQECVPMLVMLLKDPDAMVKRQALLALGKIKDKTAVLPIIEMIDPKTAGSRELLEDVTAALRSIGSHSLVREVISRLSSR